MHSFQNASIFEDQERNEGDENKREKNGEKQITLIRFLRKNKQVRTKLIIIDSEITNQLMKMITLTFDERVDNRLPICRHQEFLFRIVMCCSIHHPHLHSPRETQSSSSSSSSTWRWRCVRYFSFSLSLFQLGLCVFSSVENTEKANRHRYYASAMFSRKQTNLLDSSTSVLTCRRRIFLSSSFPARRRRKRARRTSTLATQTNRGRDMREQKNRQEVTALLRDNWVDRYVVVGGEEN